MKREDALALVVQELERVEGMHGPLLNLHHAYGVLKEELDELWDEIKKKSKDRAPAAIAMEASQVATVALRLLIHLVDQKHLDIAADTRAFCDYLFTRHADHWRKEMPTLDESSDEARSKLTEGTWEWAAKRMVLGRRVRKRGWMKAVFLKASPGGVIEGPTLNLADYFATDWEEMP